MVKDHKLTGHVRTQEEWRAALFDVRQLFEVALDPALTLSPEGRITDVNRAMEAATGLPREKLVGSDFAEYFAEPDKARAGYRQTLREGTVRDYPLTLRHVSGRALDVLYHATTYKNERGELQGVYAAARDITERKRAETATRELAAIVSSTDDAVLSVTPDGAIQSANRAALRLYGYDALQGRPVSDLAPPDLRDESRRIIERVLAGEHVDHYQIVQLRRDGSRVPVSLTVSPVHDATGKVVAISKIARDISELKQIEERLHAASLYVRTLVEVNPDPLVTLDREGKITDVNEAMIKATGVVRERLIGSDFSRHFTEPDKARAGYRQVFTTEHVVDYPLALRHRDGRLTDVLYSASVYRDPAGNVVGVLAVARDVTERKRAQDELSRSHAELEHRVQDRTAELEAANKELEAFAYSVSHDLRAPLRAVDGFARILNEEYADRLDAEGRRLLGVVRDSAQKMGQLIDDLLAFSRMGRREMAFADVDMTALATGIAGELRRLEPGRGIEIGIAPLPPAHGDPSMIRQVWVNLLSNAIKFTRPRATARIEVSGRIEGAEHIYSVQDNGVGFDMQYVGKLFGVFQRLHGPEEFEGTGVGLALAQRIVHRHGGRIWAEGRLNEGATFSFALPNKPA